MNNQGLEEHLATLITTRNQAAEERHNIQNEYEATLTLDKPATPRYFEYLQLMNDNSEKILELDQQIQDITTQLDK